MTCLAAPHTHIHARGFLLTQAIGSIVTQNQARSAFSKSLHFGWRFWRNRVLNSLFTHHGPSLGTYSIDDLIKEACYDHFIIIRRSLQLLASPLRVKHHGPSFSLDPAYLPPFLLALITAALALLPPPRPGRQCGPMSAHPADPATSCLRW